MLANLCNKKIILGSGSPRRAELLKSMGINFKINVKQTDENYPLEFSPKNVAEYLAKKKGDAFIEDLRQNEIVITADTIVSLNNTILNKPKDISEAKIMLQSLSGNLHEVITGVCVSTAKQQDVFHTLTQVLFSELKEAEIDFYVKNYQPIDKAGSYGIQEWIGAIGVKEIKGSFYNVVGLPTNDLYHHLKKIV